MAARKSATPGHALATIKIRAGALDIKHEGELPEEVAAAIIYALLVRKSPDTAITGCTVLQSIDKAGDAASAALSKARLNTAEGETQVDSQSAPIDMVLHCPKCGLQHIDAADQPITVLEAVLRANPLAMPAKPRWDNPPHRSHLCHGCGHIWRPADVPTNGVAAVKTTGKADSPIAARKQAAAKDPSP